jgi:FAD binding domain
MAMADALGEGSFGSLPYDFGRLVEGMATGHVRPATMEEVIAAVATARDRGDRVTIRAGAHSFGGQAVPDRSRVLDVTRLDAVRVEDATALCGPAPPCVRSSTLRFPMDSSPLRSPTSST